MIPGTHKLFSQLFNRIQIDSDRLLVANSQAMQRILRAMEQDASLGREMAAASHKLSKEMKADSIAMKTVSPCPWTAYMRANSF